MLTVNRKLAATYINRGKPFYCLKGKMTQRKKEEGLNVVKCVSRLRFCSSRLAAR